MTIDPNRSTMAAIVSTEDVLGGVPRLEGHRISVLRVTELVQETSPEYAADQLDISLGEVHTALAYYYEHPDEMDKLRRQRHETEQQLREQSLSPPDELER